MAAELEQTEQAVYSSASSARTIPNDDPAYAIDEESKKTEAEDGEKDVAVEKVESAPVFDVGEFPDGGLRAWLVVLGCAAGTCATFGLVNAWGVFQAYYTTTILKGTSPSTIAWIGSIQYALVFIPGLVVGRIFDMGYVKLPLGLASALLVTATFLTAECKEYWQFLLCQGIAIGLACGTIFGILMGAPAHWFKRKLGRAFGVMALGSSIAGTVHPIIVKNLIQSVGFPWTLRVLGFIEIVLLAIQFATVERRLPPKAHTGPFLDFSVFKNVSFTLYTTSAFTAFLGLYTVLTYIDVNAVSIGINEDLAFYLLSIANACSAVGRIAGGLLADRAGPLNIMTPATLVAGVMTYVWPFANSVGGNIAVAIVYGASSGVFVSLLSTPIVRMGRMEDVGVRVGMCFTVMALSAVAGPPISGAINDATGGFKFTGIYAGSTVMAAVVFLMMTRMSLLGGLWGRC
ncbi:MFS general substrate transporter [Ganoderma sinense ZZ0214-1]|uniref:MFS general substrate transporter n=1 Tax=Ganoderma sinense ZZ0214-1 TaxID=1077348 RepID=A0A2G8RSA3_9APHY|nr:MFS general substrate transporter [Ganoderma sinense ZZ0214-1]